MCRTALDVPDALIGDPGRLRQIIVNLVGNAIKFTEHGEIVVDIAADRVDGEQAGLRFTVADTGIGVAPDKQWQIFGAFVQADASTTRRYGGTGLGLTISAQLVELMGGRIWVESELGVGSRFHFVAYFGVQPHSTDAMPQVANLRGLRVLVVDDNATNRTILQEMLTSWHMSARTADSADSALAALADAADRRHPFHLVITDALMPDVDGFMLTARIKADKRHTRLKLIMLTSAGAIPPRKRAASSRITAFLTKPVKHSDLLDAITNAFAPTSASRPASPQATNTIAQHRRGLRVLVAEDNTTNQKLLVELFKPRGDNIVMVGNGQEAITRFTAEPFDVILMDIQMPGMSGLEATAAIRERERATGGHVPIVAMTAHAMAGDRERFLAEGMDGYVSKPLRADELIAAIDQLARGHGEAAPASGSHASGATQGDPSVNLATLVASVGGNEALAGDLIDVFRADAPALLATVTRSAVSGDRDALAAAAHALKGSVGLFTTGAAYETARRVEHVARDGTQETIDEACARLERDVVQVCADLAELRALLPHA